MKYLYCVKDNISGTFSLPITHNNDAEAERTFCTNLTTASLNPNAKFNPEDFSLYCVGKFEEETGFISGLDAGVSFVCHFTPVKSYIDRYVQEHREDFDL